WCFGRRGDEWEGAARVGRRWSCVPLDRQGRQTADDESADPGGDHREAAPHVCSRIAAAITTSRASVMSPCRDQELPASDQVSTEVLGVNRPRPEPIVTRT